MEGLHSTNTSAAGYDFTSAQQQPHRTRARVAAPPLQVNPSFRRPPPEESESPSPSSVVSYSPLTPIHARPTTSGSESNGDDDDKRAPSFGPKRAKASGLRAPERRKRGRVNPQQLARLEVYFAQDRSPTAARRKEISDELGMQERQTQVWFQNRRAKAKILESKPPSTPEVRSVPTPKPVAGPPPLAPPPPAQTTTSPRESPSSLSSTSHQALPADWAHMLDEDQSITVIPATELSIGSWRRIASHSGEFDLVTYLSEVDQVLTWYIRSEGRGFKMFLSFDIIEGIHITEASPSAYQVVVCLNRPPRYRIESDVTTFTGVQRIWKHTSDWTQGAQASSVFKHILLGSSPQFLHTVQSLQTQVAQYLANRPHQDRALDAAALPMELPAPPMAGLGGLGYPFHSHSHSNEQMVEVMNTPDASSSYTPSTSSSIDSNMFSHGMGYYNQDYPEAVVNYPSNFGESLAHALSPLAYSDSPLQGPYYEKEQPVSRYLKSAPATPSYSSFPKSSTHAHASHRLSFPNTMSMAPLSHHHHQEDDLSALSPHDFSSSSFDNTAAAHYPSFYNDHNSNGMDH